jgi:hypothetical protein
MSTRLFDNRGKRVFYDDGLESSEKKKHFHAQEKFHLFLIPFAIIIAAAAAAK